MTTKKDRALAEATDAAVDAELDVLVPQPAPASGPGPQPEKAPKSNPRLRDAKFYVKGADSIGGFNRGAEFKGGELGEDVNLQYHLDNGDIGLVKDRE